MTPVAKSTQTATDWYEELISRLDNARDGAMEFADEYQEVPSDVLVERVKVTMQQLRQLAAFPNLPTPKVWLAPEGEIIVSWKHQEVRFDMVFAEGKQEFARLTSGVDQHLVPPNEVPIVLHDFAA